MNLSIKPYVHYKFSNNARDTSGNKRHATATATVAYNSSAAIRGTAHIVGNGSNAYIDLPALFNTSAPWTFAFWFKGTSDTAQAIIAIINTGDTAQNQAIYIGNGATGLLTNELITLFRTATGHRLGYCSANRNELFDGNKHFIIVKYSGSACTIKLDNSSKTITVGQGSNDGLWGGLTGVNRQQLMVYNNSSSPLASGEGIDEFMAFNGITTDADDTLLYTTEYKPINRKVDSGENGIRKDSPWDRKGLL